MAGPNVTSMSYALHPLLAQTDTGSFNFLPPVDGPTFLKLYAGWFVLTFGAVLLFRWRGHDTMVTTIIGLLSYETLGALRMVIGSLAGMHRWDYLILMMFFGGIIFFVRVQSDNNGEGSWWRRNSSGGGCGSSGSSGCGGGGGGCGGGGGGCGGCGGS